MTRDTSGGPRELSKKILRPPAPGGGCRRPGGSRIETADQRRWPVDPQPGVDGPSSPALQSSSRPSWPVAVASPRIACSSPASAARRSWCAPSVGGGYGPLLRPRRLIRGLWRAFSRGLRWLQRFSRSGPYQLTQTHVRAGSWPIATDVDAGATAGAAQHRVRPGRNFGLDSVWCANRTDAAGVTAQGWEERDPLLCAKQWIPT